MQKLKNKVFRVLSMLIILKLISGLLSVQVHASSEITVNGSVEKGKISVELTDDNVADTIIINLFPNAQYFAEQFVGYNFVYPGLSSTGDFIITNNTGQTYKVTDYSFEAYVTSIRRVYNEAAINKYGIMNVANRDIVINLSGEEWYQLNAEYYGFENLYDLEVARRILGYGDKSQGKDIGAETSPEIIALGEWYLFNKSQFSFNTDKYPISNLEVENITLQDYIEKTNGNKELVLNSCFSQEIGESGFTSTIGYSIDNPSVGNAYNGAYSDFKFTLTLSRIKEDVSVTYDGNGNTGGIAPVDDNLYETNSLVIVLDNTGHLVKDGFEFNGWNTAADGSGTQFEAGDTFIINDNITLYAFWIAVSEPPPITVPVPPPPVDPELPPPVDPEPPPPIDQEPPPPIVPEAPPPIVPEPEVTDPGEIETTDPVTPPIIPNGFNHSNYIYGYPNGSVKPDSNITRSEIASIFYRLLTDSNKNDIHTSVFNDISDDKWYSQAVNYLAYKGVIVGYEDGTFRPNDSITRAEFAAVAVRFDALVMTDENVFSDVPDNHWAAKYISSAYKKGWINGYGNGTFKPEQNIRRVEVVKIVNTMLNRLVKSEDLDDSLNPFKDLTRAHWGFAHILEASLEHFYTRNDDGTEIWNK